MDFRPSRRMQYIYHIGNHQYQNQLPLQRKRQYFPVTEPARLLLGPVEATVYLFSFHNRDSRQRIREYIYEYSNAYSPGTLHHFLQIQLEAKNYQTDSHWYFNH